MTLLEKGIFSNFPIVEILTVEKSGHHALQNSGSKAETIAE